MLIKLHQYFVMLSGVMCVCCDWASLIGAAPGRGSCPIQRPLTFDLIYTDYHGLAHLHGAMGLAFLHYQYYPNF